MINRFAKLPKPDGRVLSVIKELDVILLRNLTRRLWFQECDVHISQKTARPVNVFKSNMQVVQSTVGQSSFYVIVSRCENSCGIYYSIDSAPIMNFEKFDITVDTGYMTMLDRFDRITRRMVKQYPHGVDSVS